MTKKDYELIAAVLKAERAKAPSIDAATAVNEATISLADKFGDQNPLFKRGVFLRAAGFAPL